MIVDARWSKRELEGTRETLTTLRTCTARMSLDSIRIGTEWRINWASIQDQTCSNMEAGRITMLREVARGVDLRKPEGLGFRRATLSREAWATSMTGGEGTSSLIRPAAKACQYGSTTITIKIGGTTTPDQSLRPNPPGEQRHWLLHHHYHHHNVLLSHR